MNMVTGPMKLQDAMVSVFPQRIICQRSLSFVLFQLTLSYTGWGGGWIPPLLTLVLNSVSGIQAIVLMFGDFS